MNLNKYTKGILATVALAISTLIGNANAAVYRTETDRVFIGNSIPNASDRSKPTWFWDNKKFEFKSSYRLPRQATEAKYDGNAYLTFKLRGSCFMYNLDNTFTFQIPCGSE